MKKSILIVLLCFIVAFAAFSIDMSPQPGDIVETIFTVQDNVVISQAVSAPADVLYFEQINTINYEICLSEDEALSNYFYLLNSGNMSGTAVSHVGYEAGTIFKLTDEITAIYKTEFG